MTELIDKYAALRGYIDEDGKFDRLPGKRQKKKFELMMAYLAEKFEKNRQYSEKEVNDIKLDKNNVVKVECFEGLIVDLASKHKAKSLIKGVRGPVDYDYEAQMAGMNTVMCPDLETIFLMSKPEFSFIHSSLVKQISLMGGDVTGFVSESIKNQLKTKS